MNPADIQSEFDHKKIGKGMILSVAVEGVEDHGYVIETGVKNLRGFLPVANSTTALGVGQIVFCRVTETKSANVASIAILSVVESGSRKVKGFNEPNLTYILPTTVVKFKVKKILDDGLQGSLTNDTFTAYINEHQFGATSSTKKFKENDEISLKSLRIGVQTNFDSDEIMQKFHKNSFHRVRIVAYDPMDSLYICSVDEKIIDEKFFSVEDVEVGDYVEARVIRQLKDEALQIKVGNIRGM